VIALTSQGKRYDQDPNEGNRYDHNFQVRAALARRR